jgi:hypothetical protein
MITDPQSITFSNSQLRPTADRLAGSVLDIQSLLAQWNSKNLAATITNTDDVIEDGSAVDGRTQLTGADENTFIAGLAQIQAILQANNNALLNNLFKIAVNPQN